MSQEIELKLCLTVEGAQALVDLPVFAGPSETVTQRAIYFDTADLDVIEGGLCLRIRESNGRFVQTIKGDSQPGAGLFARSEEDLEVEGVAPRVAPDSALASLIGTEPLLALFEVRNERRLWQLTIAGARIEAALDFGHVVAGDRYSPYVELELELIHGPASALFELGRAIIAKVPVRLGVVSKAERGYRLLGPLASRYRAEPISLAPDITIGKAFPLIAAACLRHYLLNVELLQDGRRTDARATLALHQGRVALRRLRAAIQVFRPLLRADDDTRRLDRGLRRLGRILGEARDLDVLLANWPGDGGEAGAGGGGQQERGVKKAEAARARAHDQVRETLVDAQATELLFDLIQWLGEGIWLRAPELEELRDTPCSALAVDALHHYRARIRKRGKHFGEIDDARRHRLRKDIKTLRYATEFFAPLFAEGGSKRAREREGFLSALENAQDRLGDWNDYVTAPEVMAGLGLDRRGNAATGAGARRGAASGAARETAASPAPSGEGAESEQRTAALLKEAQRALREFSQARRFWPR